LKAIRNLLLERSKGGSPKVSPVRSRGESGVLKEREERRQHLYVKKRGEMRLPRETRRVSFGGTRDGNTDSRKGSRPEGKRKEAFEGHDLSSNYGTI